jgi:Asp-tRNA(Asn)/Glu-tRNA(Gln) amidotransferase A subunit family amidase
MRRRAFLAYFSSIGLGSSLFPGCLWAMAQEKARITREMIAEAARVAGLSFDENEQAMMAEGVNESLAAYDRLREVPLSNSVPPALLFDPLPIGRSRPPPGPRRPAKLVDERARERPEDLEEVAFWPLAWLAPLLRTGQVSSTELTEMYLSRLEWYDEKLHCVITLTRDLALRQAEEADAEIAAGRYRGPLHGIPWGAKDLLHTRGIRTTYGARPFEEQVFDDDATVVQRLREAGAVLVAKLSLGALAMGDVWFAGEELRTRNPWNLEQGSSGSSAGSAASVSAGLVGFALGTETLGSIVSPCSRCGATGLRPTYGRVSRAGAMALSWSMDKLGPIARSVEDCALVFAAIEGADPRDPTAVSAPFEWPLAADPKSLRVGYVAAAFDSEDTTDQDREALEALRELGHELRPVELPDLPVDALLPILGAEAAAAFDDLVRDGRVDQLVRQDPGAWPNLMRTARLIPAVEYLRANRVRTLLIEAMDRTFADVDAVVTPPYAGGALLVTNLTGHPCVVLPHGFREDGTPTSLTFLGRLYGEDRLLAVARHYQEATGFHRRHPDLESS